MALYAVRNQTHHVPTTAELLRPLWHHLKELFSLTGPTLLRFQNNKGETVAEVAADRKSTYFVRTKENHLPLGSLLENKLQGGELLVRRALEEAKKSKRPFGEVLVEMDPLALEEVRNCLRIQATNGLQEISRLEKASPLALLKSPLSAKFSNVSFPHYDLWSSIVDLALLEHADHPCVEGFFRWKGKAGGALALLHLDEKGVAPALLHGLSIEEEEDLKLEHSMWSILKQPCLESANIHPKLMFFSDDHTHWLFLRKDQWALAIRSDSTRQRNLILSDLFRKCS